jgi:N-acylethanolamine-hydrolysing acid amidase
VERRSHPVEEFEINLDSPPELRFLEVSQRFRDQFLKIHDAMMNNSGAQHMAQSTVWLRGDEEPEQMAELRGISKATGVPDFYLQFINLNYPLQTLKGPFFSYLHYQNPEKPLPTETELAKFMTSPDLLKNIHAFGCTSILARDDEDGTVWHARNFDYGYSQFSQNLTYNAVFTKGGKEVYTAQLTFPQNLPLTAIRRGPNGYSWNLNTRYCDNIFDSMEVMKQVFQEKRNLSGWVARKILENTDNYEDAVKAFSETPYPNPEFNIISGVRKGTILARRPEGLAYKLDLDKNHSYVLVTNFDHVYNDPKEWLFDTRSEGVSGRVRAETLLNASRSKIIPEYLLQVLNDNDVIANTTIYQALINVEHGYFNSTHPHCRNCGVEL